MNRPFNSDLVLEEKVSDKTLKGYHVGFDQNKFRLTPLVDVIRSVIPEFAFGYHEGKNIPLTDIVEKLKEAAQTVYLTDKYKKRGEFGELILHLLLRDFCNTIPLVSKIYFKDANNSIVHGFDGVQITANGKKKKLWLGESKLYKDGKAGVKELAEDIKKHVNANYLRREFALISRKLPKDIPEINYWRKLMDKHQTLDKIYSSVVIPLVCTYSSSLFETHFKETKKYISDFILECNTLHECFLEKVDTSVEFYLMLLPVPDKNILNEKLDERLKRMQKL
jgi:hypothetical protein